MNLFEKIQLEAYKILENKQKYIDKKIQKAYSMSYTNVKYDLLKLFEKYEQDGKLSYSELSKANRLTNLKEQLEEELKKATKDFKSLTISGIDDAYTLGTFYQAYGIDMTLDIRGSWGVFNTEAVKANILRDKYLSDFLTEKRALQIRRIRDIITDAIIRGTSKRELTKILQKAMAEGASSASNIAQTETTAAFGRAQELAYQTARDQGIELTEYWDSTAGAKNPRHDPVENNKQRESDGLFHMASGGTCSSPGNCSLAKDACRCRCRLRAELVNFEELEKEPAATFGEWSKKYKGVTI